jgi:hypothetical protein
MSMTATARSSAASPACAEGLGASFGEAATVAVGGRDEASSVGDEHAASTRAQAKASPPGRVRVGPQDITCLLTVSCRAAFCLMVETTG